TNTLLERLNGHEEIDDSTELQSYKGLPLSRPSARQAARQVSKEILAFHGKPVHVFFHSTCAGMTSTANDVFGGNNEGYP
ncbi:hypothetical protein ACP3V9_25035, partial [Salmonella enterica]|uniref:hypothetical protein n=1 Tax=Salmonella enterica TaxID=28901 RepID=UPI003CFA73D9